MYPVQKPLQQQQVNIGDINVGATNDSTTKFLTLSAGLVCVGNSEIQHIVFQFLMILFHQELETLVEHHLHNLMIQSLFMKELYFQEYIVLIHQRNKGI